MRKLVAGTFLTLDGVMQAPGGPDEDRDGGFRHGGWLVPFFDEKFGAIMTEWTKRADAFLLGRRTYEIFAAYWPKATDPTDEIAVALNTRPKIVASRTLDKVDWSNSILLKGTLPRRSRGSKLKKAARFRSTAAATFSRPCSGTILSIRCASGCFPQFSAPASACLAKARSRAASGLSTHSRPQLLLSCMSMNAPAPSGTARSRSVRSPGAGDLRQYELGSLKKLMFAGAAVTSVVFRKAIERFGNIFIHRYGATETMGSACILRPGEVAQALAENRIENLGSCGRS
jgi:hypothetical protein